MLKTFFSTIPKQLSFYFKCYISRKGKVIILFINVKSFIVLQNYFLCCSVQSTKILLLPSKCEKKKFLPFKNGHHNIGLFSIASHLVIALPTLRYQKLSLLISLIQFLYEFCDINSCRSFTLLKALAKSNGNLFAIAFKSEKGDSWKRDNFRERGIKKEAKN